MKLIGKFILSKRRSLIFFLLSAVLLLVSFSLYQLPMKAIIYPLLLCLFLGLLFAAFEFLSFRKRHRILTGLVQNSPELASALPAADNLIDEDYQQLIRLLDDRTTELLSRNTQKYNAMVDYYTVWVHQIKTPIAAMRLTLQNEDSDTARRLLRDLSRIERYVEMVLTFLKLDAGSTDYVIKSVDLDSVIKAAARSFSSEFILKGLRLDYTEIRQTVLSDEKWLSFILEQVLSNAVKYTDSGTVSIRFEQPDTLCIKDTGIGIAAEDLPRIFENGFTGFNGRSDKKASGIGLYLCKQLCDKLGHRITARSAIVDGTEIRIVFGTDAVVLE